MSKSSYHPAKTDVAFSQNFLTGSYWIQTLTRCANIEQGDHIVEIGPGKGHITRAMLALAGRVTAVEMDARLCERLHARFAGQESLRLIQGDFLQWPLPSKGAYKVVANIPFGQTTAIIRKLIEAENPPHSAYLIVQREAARALCGVPRECMRSLELKTAFDANILRTIPRDAFHPAPSVDAALLCLRRSQGALSRREAEQFRCFLRACFRSSNGLRSVFNAKQMNMALRFAGVAPHTRMSDILYTQWLCLFRCALQYHILR